MIEIRTPKAGLTRRTGLIVTGLITLTIIGAGLAWWATTGSSSNDLITNPAGGTTQKSEGGQVTVEVTWNGSKTKPAFNITMDTHAVDLDGYDLQQIALLRTDQGREARPVGWEAPKGGHHRQGTLTFPVTSANNTPLFEPNTRTIELVIPNVGGVPERVLRWVL